MSETTFVASLEARAQEIVDRCSRCGRCVEVCPTAGPAGGDRSDPPSVVGQVLELLRGAGDPASAGARWAETCTGPGACPHGCGDGGHPPVMVAPTRRRAHVRTAVRGRGATRR